MIGKLNDHLAFGATALRLRAERQQLLAANIANADTPGYKAVDFDFAAALRNATATGQGTAASAASPRHLPVGNAAGAPTLAFRTPSQAALDGNSVELDAERAQFADNAIRYEASLRFLNGQIKTLMSAISG
ncbi:MAG: flagellar basal body rod protein FlgB [Burkholderiales bacterium]|nr:flagellar basal body rod protein FlgB [Burkholderiales bacterium]